eukprot:TRINITY_DN82832_c0_g1_i1.p1 TRINITY_DN82832_c0_g1~~TRINITY_DN82832_c0_g1_i1.p1  ORF type:complete len:567 (+),score=107.32 TRINITY_DN82832_c0_g1_i1:126-1826(+)
MKFSSFWRRFSKKTQVQAFTSDGEAEDNDASTSTPVAESEPSSPRHHCEGSAHAKWSLDRPATTDEEMRPPQNNRTPRSPAVTAAVDRPHDLLLAAAGPFSEKEVAAAAAAPVDVCERSHHAFGSSATAPPPPAHAGAASGAMVSQLLDVRLDDVLAKVEAEFGQLTAQSLRSSKWDKRVQALKSIGVVLKGLDLGGSKPSAMKGLRLRDRSSCWRTSCQVLHQSIRDKVMPVRLASHDLFRDTFAHTDGVASKEEIHALMTVLLEHIIDRLGDSNLRLHESARSCVLFCAQASHLVGLPAVLAMLQTRLDAMKKSRERPKVFFGVLDTVNFLLQHFPSVEAVTPTSTARTRPSWTQEDIQPFVTAGMDDSLGPRVRTSAVTLAVTLRVTFGSDAVEPLVQTLRPAVQAVLRERFMEFDGDSDVEEDEAGAVDFVPPSADLMSGLMVCGSSIRPTTPQVATPSLPGSTQGEDEDMLMDEILEDTGMVFGRGTDHFCLDGEPYMFDVKKGRAGSLASQETDFEAALSELLGLDEDSESEEEQPARPRRTDSKSDSKSVRFASAIEVF